MQSFSEIGIHEVRTLTVGMKRLLGTSDALVDGDVEVSIEVYDKNSEMDGGDLDAMLNGDAQVNDGAVTIKGVSVPIGQAILQSIDATEGQEGCTYVLTYKFTLAGDIEETITEDVLFTITKYVPKD